MKIEIVLFVLLLSFLSNAEDHFKRLEKLNGNEIKGYSVYKNKLKANGLLVLLDGFPGGNNDPEGSARILFRSTKLAHEAYKNNIATIIIPYYRKLFIDDSLYSVIHICISNAIIKFQIKNNNFAIGGWSAGGNIAIGFAEHAIQEKNESDVPKAIFGVDPPIELTELYKYCIREINRNCQAPTAYIGINEAKDLKILLDKTLGYPEDSSQNYLKYSPYTMFSKNGGNAKYLLNLPIRLYNEIDPMWYIKERCRTLFDENICSCVSMIHYLYLSGNKNAEVIITQNKGFRPNGMRHPHSWSIVDEKNCIKWIKTKFK